MGGSAGGYGMPPPHMQTQAVMGSVAPRPGVAQMQQQRPQVCVVCVHVCVCVFACVRACKWHPLNASFSDSLCVCLCDGNGARPRARP